MIDRQQVESLLLLAGILIFLLGAFLAWLLLPWFSGGQLIVLAVSLLVLMLWVGFQFVSFLQTYVFGVRRLAEETELIRVANPRHRIRIDGPADIHHLAEAINAFADRFQNLLDNEANQIQQARAGLEEEKNRLLALMSELAEGVLVCNLEGQILLYNNQAKLLLGQERTNGASGNQAGGFVGLGRSVFGLIDRKSITHALEDLRYRSEKKNPNLVSQFVTTATNGRLIRTRMAPVRDQQANFSGFLLTLEDITRRLETSIRRDALLQSLTEGTRASLANIRAAIETIEAYPNMDPGRLSQFRQVIRQEAQTLTDQLNQTMTDYAADLKSQWQLEQMSGGDLLWAIQHRLEDKVGIKTDIEFEEDDLWLNVDSYTIVQAITNLVSQLKADFGVEQISFRLRRTGRVAALDVIWAGAPIDTELLWSWQNQPLGAGDVFFLTLNEVAERHGGEVWCQADRASDTAYLRLLLPTTQPKPTWRVAVTQGSRPEYYDFDLFHQPDQKSHLDDQPLSALSYTVFDTETTGLNPSAGDEIISIGAVRLVNGRLLRQEVFDQLINPNRPIPQTSINIHGIVPAMLKDQPTIEQVLPQFHHFIEDTVLIAHNAAFDMRMLQLKEARAGVKFANPVLDTLLLAVVVHPQQEGYSLEAVAQRLGVNIIGRHTSLGDAIVTGEIFLKLVPLLTEKGIVTLRQARSAAEKTYYARLTY
jgi:DNA polymerase-3 subunit epsilon